MPLTSFAFVFSIASRAYLEGTQLRLRCGQGTFKGTFYFGKKKNKKTKVSKQLRSLYLNKIHRKEKVESEAGRSAT
jgi:hypothetical protein